MIIHRMNSTQDMTCNPSSQLNHIYELYDVNNLNPKFEFQKCMMNAIRKMKKRQILQRSSNILMNFSFDVVGSNLKFEFEILSIEKYFA